MSATTLATLDTGVAALLIGGQVPLKVAFPLAADPFATTPKFAKKEAEHQVQMAQCPEFATPEAIIHERQLLAQALLQRLQALPSPEPAGQLTQADVPKPAPVVIDDRSPLPI